LVCWFLFPVTSQTSVNSKKEEKAKRFVFYFCQIMDY
jgi:hypothetical protein